ncbi:hypothetical protein NDN08_002080 [Rhodosorus marinus]|uniref:Alpha 1,4-glycosyltransferase domain-containing protein n=1 Tax=Rhodosorus marinus TaxID=101924 RepID=A0AAV8UWV4_9RHOD|nr:hypothetical protein NDN08_002080 [Rhodosorus marinus]
MVWNPVPGGGGGSSFGWLSRRRTKHVLVLACVVLAFSIVGIVLIAKIDKSDTAYSLDTTWRRTAPDAKERYVRMIPRVIWQTVKSHEVPKLAYDAGGSWTHLNPTYDRIVLDDSEVLQFVKRFYNETEFDLFKSMPVGVMKADFFRYMVVYIHGGVYADADTINHKSIDEWVDSDCQFVVAPEDNDGFFCQWAFAAIPRHPILKRLVELIFEKLANGPDYSNPHFVHGVTGPAIWTIAIREVLGISPDEKLNPFILTDRAKTLRKDQGICWLTTKELVKALSNLSAHDNPAFVEVGWSNWFAEAGDLRKKLASETSNEE